VWKLGRGRDGEVLLPAGNGDGLFVEPLGGRGEVFLPTIEDEKLLMNPPGVLAQFGEVMVYDEWEKQPYDEKDHAADQDQYPDDAGEQGSKQADIIIHGFSFFFSGFSLRE